MLLAALLLLATLPSLLLAAAAAAPAPVDGLLGLGLGLPAWMPAWESVVRDLGEDPVAAAAPTGAGALPNPRGAPLAEGIIRLSAAQTKAECRSQLNSTCFGRCLAALRVSQRGPLHNVSSVADHPTSPFRPVPRPFDDDDKDKGHRPCDCQRGFGVYLAGSRTALWYFRGPTDASPPRVLNVSVVEEAEGEGPVDGDGKAPPRLVVRHAGGPLAKKHGCAFVFDVAEGSVMGLKGPGGGPASRPSPHAEFPIWATILLALAGVLFLSGLAFVVIRVRSPSANASSSASGRRRQGQGQQPAKEKAGARLGKANAKGKGKKAVTVTVSTEGSEDGDGDVASLRDPLLAGGGDEEGKIDGTV